MEKDMKIGICLWEYKRRYPLKEAAKQLFADGYEAIDFSELHNVKGPFYTEDESKVKALLEEEASILSAEGIKVSQIHGPWRYPPEDGTAQARAEWLSLMERAARMATYLGTPYMVVHPLMPFGADSSENPAEVLRINTEHYARLCDYAKEIGVTVCLENMPFPNLPLAHVSQILSFVDSLGKKNLKVCLDTGHANVCGMKIDEAIRMLGDRLAVFHIHDNNGKSDQHLMPGLGNIDFRGMGAALAEIGFDGVLSSEAHVGNDAPDEEFRKNAKAMADTLIKIKENHLI